MIFIANCNNQNILFKINNLTAFQFRFYIYFEFFFIIMLKKNILNYFNAKYKFNIKQCLLLYKFVTNVF